MHVVSYILELRLLKKIDCSITYYFLNQSTLFVWLQFQLSDQFHRWSSLGQKLRGNKAKKSRIFQFLLIIQLHP